MALPQTKVEVAFDAGFATPEDDRTWVDVSDDVEAEQSITITYGRADELATPDPNTCVLTLDNDSGNYTPDNADSDYYPDVKKGKPERVTMTYDGVDYTRYTGYIDTWPISWPDGTDKVSTISISSTSRRARLGRTASLSYSPIRYAYALPDHPQAYWPMANTVTTIQGTEIFLDATNTGAPVIDGGGNLNVFTSTAALQPFYDESLGVIDEGGLLKFPRFSDINLLGTRSHYVGAGGACMVNTAGELTFEMVARFVAPPDSSCLIQLLELQCLGQTIHLTFANFGSAALGTLETQITLYDDAGSIIHYEIGDSTPAAYAAVNDGQVHHFAITLTGGNAATLYVDGVSQYTVTFPGPYVFDDPFTSVVMGADTYMGDAWIGHAAVRDQALTADEIAAHAAAATTSDESIAERLQRLVGYIGVPADEVTAETSVAVAVGDQSQIDRAPITVADELATSTGGILYDTREGHLHMQARNHRYNQTPVFTLDASTQEIQGDLAPVLDDRYLVNFITVSRTGVEDTSESYTVAESVAAYGTYSQALEVVTSSWEEARSAANYIVYRYSEPEVRVNTITVDVVNLEASQRAAVLNADIGTLFEITNLPDQAPDTTMALYVEGYTETITESSHTISFNTTPGDMFTNVAVLDDAAHDVLGSGIVLAY